MSQKSIKDKTKKNKGYYGLLIHFVIVIKINFLSFYLF